MTRDTDRRWATLRLRRIPRSATPALLGACALGACVMVALSGCVAEVDDGVDTAPSPIATLAQPMPTGDGTLMIGALVPLSGAAAASGTTALAGVELAVRDIRAAGGLPNAEIVVVHGDSGEAAGGEVADAVTALAARGADAIVGPFGAVLAEPAGDADVAAAAAGVPLVAVGGGGIAATDAFTERLRTSDPAVTDARFGAEAYDATVMLALAAKLAGDDGPGSIAQFLPEVTTGGIECGSFGACVDALGERQGIRYTGVLGDLTAEGLALRGRVR